MWGEKKAREEDWWGTCQRIFPFPPPSPFHSWKRMLMIFLPPQSHPPSSSETQPHCLLRGPFLSNLITFYPFWWLGLKVCSVSEEVVTHSFLPAFSLFPGVQAFLSVLGRQGREMEMKQTHFINLVYSEGDSIRFCMRNLSKQMIMPFWHPGIKDEIQTKSEK